jgi:hypothetical protein
MASKNTNIINVVQSMMQLLRGITRPIWWDATSNRLRTDTTGTITTVSTVTTVSQIAAFDAKQTVMYSLDRTCWNQNVRTRIS